MPTPTLTSYSMQSDALKAAILAGCSPTELAQALIDPTIRPPRSSGGYSILGARACALTYALREYGPGRTARVVIDTVDLTCTYTIRLLDVARGVDESVAYDATSEAPADEAELITQWIAAIEADAAVAALIDVTANADNDGLLITWKSPIATGFILTQSSAAALTVTLDYEQAVVGVYVTHDLRSSVAGALTVAAEWQPYVYQGEPLVLALTDGTGWRATALPCASLSAMYVYSPASSLAGHADDPAAGTASGVTTAYRAPVAYVAPGVLS